MGFKKVASCKSSALSRENNPAFDQGISKIKFEVTIRKIHTS